METVNIHYAKTHLSRLIEKAAKGEPFVIAKAGKPMVEVRAVSRPPADVSKRLGFAEGRYKIPDDIKTPFKDEIDEMFKDYM
jgi:antitoxin (DNA-binding transcriptional repressor) of toxin-antitoxin stability system